MSSPVIRIANASPARYLQEARRAVSPEEFALGVRQVWDQVMAKGDVRAFLAVAPYLVGQLKREEVDAQETVLDRFVQVIERRQELLAKSEAPALEGEIVDAA